MFKKLTPQEISIHAPTKGATSSYTCAISSIPISIHAPTKGATEEAAGCGWIIPDFNPRSHEGSDAMMYLIAGYAEFQSTLPRRERLFP